MLPFTGVGWVSCVVAMLVAATLGQQPGQTLGAAQVFGGRFQHFSSPRCNADLEQTQDAGVNISDPNGAQCYRHDNGMWWSIWYDTGSPGICYGCYRTTAAACRSECNTGSCLASNSAICDPDETAVRGASNCSCTYNATCRQTLFLNQNHGPGAMRLTCTGLPLCPNVTDDQTCGDWCFQHNSIGGHDYDPVSGQCGCGGTLSAGVGHVNKCTGSASDAAASPPPTGPGPSSRSSRVGVLQSSKKLSAADDIGIGIGAFAFIAIVTIVVCYFKKGCCFKSTDDEPDEIFLMGKWQAVA